jgi:iron-sulfur cluster repair protein YtfE (RIC family)
MGARGAAAAAEAADAVLLVDRLDRVADAIAAARRARGIALQSIAIGMGLSAAAMGAAALGYLPPVYGALLQEAIDVAVILNALRVLSGGARPRPMPASAEVPRVLDEHVRLRALTERMRHTAERLHRPREVPGEELRGIATELRALLLPHQQAEEQHVFPELARRLGGRDPLATMAQMHDDIAEHATRFAELVEGLRVEAASRAEMREAQRLLFVLDAVLTLHLAAEEALLAEVEDAPASA